MTNVRLVLNTGLIKITNQNQIRDRDAALTLDKTKSKTETQIWCLSKPNPGQTAKVPQILDESGIPANLWCEHKHNFHVIHFLPFTAFIFSPLTE